MDSREVSLGCNDLLGDALLDCEELMDDFKLGRFEGGR